MNENNGFNMNNDTNNKEPKYEAADYGSRYNNTQEQSQNSQQYQQPYQSQQYEQQSWDNYQNQNSYQSQGSFQNQTSGNEWHTIDQNDWNQSTRQEWQNTASNTNKAEKKPGFGVKLAKAAAIAAVFGLVAGGVFQGVDIAADYFRGTSETTVQTPVTTTTTTNTGGVKETDITQLVKNAMPSMVSITSTVTTNYEFFGQQLSEDQEGSGSGFIVGMNNKELLIATNNHVIAGATTIQVSFIDNEVVEAEVKGTASSADLAVVSVPLKNIKESTLQSIKVATLGDSDSVQLGEKVVAIGNALGYGQSITVGYISATDRQVSVGNSQSQNTMTLLQTDAAINPGNSGGALLNMNGEVIGINSVKYADTKVEGMGYAIPVSSATPIINELMNYEKLNENEKGYLGITGTDITEGNNLYNMPTGVYIYDVAKGGAAEKGGMQKGDIITAINGNAVTNMEAVKQKVNNTRVGTEISVTVMRNENGEYVEKELKVTLQGKKSLDSLMQEQEEMQQQQPQQQIPEGNIEENPFSNGLLDEFLERFGN